MAFGIDFKTEYQLLIIGGVILTGIIGLLINAMDSNNYGIAILKIIGATVLVLAAFFSLEEVMRFS
jgi:hypothetical protein